MRLFHWIVSAIIVLAPFGIGMADEAPQKVWVPLPGEGVTTGVVKPVNNWQAKRFSGVTTQQFDFSCGAAVITTLLRSLYGKEVNELTVINDMLKGADRQSVEANGFSMLDMKRYAESLGFAAEGFQISAAKLQELLLPVITLLDIRGYYHYVIVKRVINGQVLLSDPAFGNRVMPLDEFQKGWNGTVLAIVGDQPRRDSPLIMVDTPKTPELRARVLTNTLPSTPVEFGPIPSRLF